MRCAPHASKAAGQWRRWRWHLRELRGKKARLRSKVRDLSGLISEEEADARAGTAAEALDAGVEAAPPEPEGAGEAAAGSGGAESGGEGKAGA